MKRKLLINRTVSIPHHKGVNYRASKYIQILLTHDWITILSV